MSHIVYLAKKSHESWRNFEMTWRSLSFFLYVSCTVTRGNSNGMFELPNYGDFVVVGSQRQQIQMVPHWKGRRGCIWQVARLDLQINQTPYATVEIFGFAVGQVNLASFSSPRLAQESKDDFIGSRTRLDGSCCLSLIVIRKFHRNWKVWKMETDEPIIPSASFGKRSMGYKRQVSSKSCASENYDSNI